MLVASCPLGKAWVHASALNVGSKGVLNFRGHELIDPAMIDRFRTPLSYQ